MQNIQTKHFIDFEKILEDTNINLLYCDEEHSYALLDGTNLSSVTQILSKLKISKDYSKVEAATLENASKYGKKIHSVFENFIKHGVIEPMYSEEVSHFLAATADVLNSKLNHYAEERFYCGNIAGTVDFIQYDKENNIITLIDYKTTSMLDKVSTSIQLSFYWYLIAKSRELYENIQVKAYALHCPKINNYKLVPLTLVDYDTILYFIHCFANDEEVLNMIPLSDNKIETLKELYTIKKELEKQLEAVENEISPILNNPNLIAWLENNKVTKFANLHWLSYSLASQTSKFDTKAFKAKFPEVYNDFVQTTTKKGYFRFNEKAFE